MDLEQILGTGFADAGSCVPYCTVPVTKPFELTTYSHSAQVSVGDLSHTAPSPPTHQGAPLVSTAQPTRPPAAFLSGTTLSCCTVGLATAQHTLAQVCQRYTQRLRRVLLLDMPTQHRGVLGCRADEGGLNRASEANAGAVMREENRGGDLEAVLVRFRKKPGAVPLRTHGITSRVFTCS